MKILIAAAFLASSGVAYGQAPTDPATSPPACPVTTQVESTAIARAWHDDVVNRRNPTKLSDILGPEVVHHAAGGYPKIMNAEGVAAMMDDFLAAFSRRMTSSWSVTRQVERIRDRSAICNLPTARRHGLALIYFALVADALSKFGQRSMPKGAGDS
jgi:hypothetical protein